mmetsp:Transcript_69533/g.226069  ORF Transcript_69533/g.226069 Transcript_69533/m.226069 type:complete len:206 (+) Transcript_69533:923-1540(+)
MFGTYRTFKGLGNDYLDLFKLNVSEKGNILVEQLGSKRLNCWLCFVMPLQVLVIGIFMFLSFAAVVLAAWSIWVASRSRHFSSASDVDDEQVGSDDEHSDAKPLADHMRQQADSSWTSIIAEEGSSTSTSELRRLCLRHLFCKLLLPVYMLLSLSLVFGVAAWYVVRGPNFSAGAGVYVNSPDEILVYAVDWEPSGGVIAVTEFS